MTCTAIINGKPVKESELHHYYIYSTVISQIIRDVNERISNQGMHDFDEPSK